MGQGIVVNIQAKIEGWQEQIKQIQNAMKNIKPGTEISKGLTKDLQQVESMVNNLGKNMSQRLTSNSQLNSFIDKMRDVEQVFNRIGNSMQKVSFGEMNPEYITSNFKELLDILDKANDALGKGMQSSFQTAINDSKVLQKEFDRMKLDPKNMNMDSLREALSNRGKSLTKDMEQAAQETEHLKQKMDEAKQSRDELQNRKNYIGNDFNAKAMQLLGGKIPTNGTILDPAELRQRRDEIRAAFINMGFTEGDLNRILPSVDKIMQAAQWDQLPAKLEGYIRTASVKTENSLAFANNKYNQAKSNYYTQVGVQNHLSALRYGNNAAQNELNSKIAPQVEQATRSLREEVNNITDKLQTQATQGIIGLGGKIASESASGYEEAAIAMKNYSAELDRINSKEQMMGKVQGVVQRYFSIYAAVRMASKGIRNMMQNIKGLDKTITDIAIVTKMNQDDLWGQMPQYTKMANQYAASISGVYEVSQLYYQQGLNQAEVMSLTEETLKMARISGLDYADATDYMTNAIRSFKMEMSDAGTVVDVYSAVAASSASSVTELATAMSKTASSAAAVGSSFENTTAMLAVMIEATRESPENIGSAMKSIISRYGELKENKTGIDEEGEAYSLNKVDTALQTVGISVHDANGEFRDLDDVIMELAEKWDTIDKNTQRYIATIMAGNRQQSRFLALVSSYDRLREESEKAANSEDAAQLQFLKTLDSVEAKTQQLQTSLQSLYTSSGMEKLYKGALDFGKALTDSLSNLSQKSGLGAAIGKIAADFTNIATLATTAFSVGKSKFSASKRELEYGSKIESAKADQAAAYSQLAYLQQNPVTPKVKGHGKKAAVINTDEVKEYERNLAAAQQASQAADARTKTLEAQQQAFRAQAQKIQKIQGLGMAASAAGMALGTWANAVDINKQRGLKGGLTIGSSALSGLGTGLMVGATAGGPIGAVVGVLSALPGVIQGIGMLSESTEERLQRLQDNIQNTNNTKLKNKDDLKSLEEYKQKYDELNKTQDDSAEKKKEFLDLQNEIASTYPSLISGLTAEGNYIIDMADAYDRLAKAKGDAYKQSFLANTQAELEGLKDIDYVLKNIYNYDLAKNNKKGLSASLGASGNLTEQLPSLMASYIKNPSAAAQTISSQMNYATAQQLFGANPFSQGVVSTARSTHGLNLWFSAANMLLGEKPEDAMFDSDLTQKGQSDYSKVLLGFMEAINSETVKDWTGAYDYVKSKFEGQGLDTIIDSFDSKTIFPELEAAKDAAVFQNDLINNKLKSANSEWIQMLAAEGKTVGLETNDVQMFALGQEAMKGWEQYQADHPIGSKFTFDGKELEVNEENLGKLYSKFLSDELTPEWYNSSRQALDYLSSNTVNDIYNNLGKYTQKDLGKIKGISQEAAQTLTDAWTENTKSLITSYTNGVKSSTFTVPEATKNILLDFTNLFGPEYLSGILENYRNIIDNAQLSDAQKNSQVNNLTDLYSTIGTITDQADRNAVLSKVRQADFTSLIGIYDLVTELSGLDVGIDLSSLIAKVKTFGSSLAVNFETEIDSYYDKIESSVDDFNKAITAATSGTDLKTAREMADKMGKSLKDFTVRDGKFYFDDIDALREAYIKSNDEYIADVKKNVKDRYQGLEKLSEISLGEDEKLQINGKDILSGQMELSKLQSMLSPEKAKVAFQEETGIPVSDFLKYYEDFQAQLEDGTNDFTEYMLQQVGDKLGESGDAILEYLNQSTKIFATSQLKSGDITGFLKTTGIMKSSAKLKKEAEQAIQSDPQKLRETQLQAEQKAAQAKQAYLEGIVDDIQETNPYNLAQDIYAKGAGENKAFEKDIRKRAEEMAEQAKKSNEYALQYFPKKSELAESYKSAALDDIKKEWSKRGKEVYTPEEIRAQAKQLSQTNAILNASIVSNFKQSKDYLSEVAQDYIDNGTAAEALRAGVLKDGAKEQFATLEEKEQMLQDWISSHPHADQRAIDEQESWIDNTYTTLSNEQLQTQAQHMADHAKEINQNNLNNLLKITDVDSLTRKLTRELEQAGGHIINDEEIEKRANEYAQKAKAENDKWLQDHLKETDPDKIYDELAAQYKGIKTEDEIREEVKKKVEENAAKNKELQEFVTEAMNPDYWMEEATEEYKKQLEKEQEAAYSDLIASIGHGEIDNLPSALREYAADIYEIYGGVQSSIMNSMMTSLEGGSDKIKVTAENAAILNDYVKMGLIKGHTRTDEQGNVVYDEAGNFPIIDALEKGDLAEINVEKLRAMRDEDFYNLVNSIETDEQNKSKILDQFLKIKYPDIVSSTTGLAEKTSLTRDEFQNHLKNMGVAAEELNKNESFQKYVEQYGLVFDSATNTYQVLDENYDQYISQLEKDLEGASDSATKTEAQIKLNAARRIHANKKASAQVKAFQDVISNYSKVTDDQITALQESLSDGEWEEIEDYITPLGTGEYKLDVGGLKSHLSELGLSEKVQEAILGMFDSIADDYLKNITTATSLVSQGTTSQQDIQKFIQSAKQLGIDAEGAFSYDSILNAWTLNATTMGKYVQAQAQQLVDDGLLSADEVSEYVNKNVSQALAGAVDIKNFLDAENKQGQAREKLAKQLANIIDPRQLLYEQYLKEEEANYDANSIELKQAVHAKVADASQETLKIAQDKYVESLISTIEDGGIDAVNAMQAIATLQGKELTSADIESAYKAQVSQIEKASEQLSLGVGSLVSGDSVQMLEDAGYSLQRMGDGNTAVINQIGDISIAYANYYQALSKSGEATLQALNEAKAKVLETKDGRAAEQSAIDALGNAAGMTYSTFGQLLSDMGIELTDDLMNTLESSGIIEAMGGSKMRIKDFAAFARRMNWDFNSEEYFNAFSSFNDGLIEQNKKNKTQSADELDKLKEAKPGDWLNLTQTERAFKKFSKEQSKEAINTAVEVMNSMNAPAYAIAATERATGTFYTKLQEDLRHSGAILDDGILKLSENANLLGVAETLKNAAIESGSEMSSQLQDMVRTVVSSYTDAITKGITGGMTVTEREDLIKKGADLGVELDVDSFRETMDGFQLTTNKALELYTAMGRRDTKQQKKLFKTLGQQLKETNAQYSTATSMLSHIAEMQRELNELRQQGNDINKERIKQLEDELLLAKELQMNSLTHEDQSWNFLSNDAIPASIDNAINYFQNWGQARDLLGKWGIAGRSDLNQFASMLKQVSEIAEATGEARTFMGKKVDKNSYNEFLDNLWGMVSWNPDSKQYELSNAKMAKYGYNMLLGSAGISKDLEAGIDQYAQMNADKLQDFNEFFDGLGSIYDSFNDYTDKTNKHKFEDFLDPISGNFDYEGFMNQIGKNQKALDAFNKFTEKVKINGDSYADVMGKGKKEFEKGSKEYKAIKGIIAMAMSEDWDPESDYQAIADQLSSSGFEGEIQLGDTLFTVREGKVVTQILTGDNAGYYDPYGGGPYDDISDVWNAINRKDLEDYNNSIDKYNKSQESSTETITLAGATLNVLFENGQVIIKTQDGKEVGKGGTLNEAIANAQSGLAGVEGTTTEASTYTAEGWLASQSASYQNARVTFGEGGNGIITEQARATMQKNGLLTADSIQSAYKAAIDSVAAANNLEGADAAASNVVSKFGDAVAAEMYSSTGIKLDAKDMPVEIDGDLAGKIADQVNMTQAAADVMNGLNAAIQSAATQTALGEAITNGLKGAMGENGSIPIDVKIDPNEESFKSIEKNKEALSAPIEIKVNVVKGTVNLGDDENGPGLGQQIQDNLSTQFEGYSDGAISTSLNVSADTTQASETVNKEVNNIESQDPTIHVKTESEGKAEELYDSSQVPEGITEEVTYEGTTENVPPAELQNEEREAHYSVTSDPIPEFPDLSRSVTYTVSVKGAIQGALGILSGFGKVTGNIALPGGSAHAKSTLMGELGPEMVVSNGRYFIVGQEGPEMVNLADDAIVFNHLQTQSLLEKGSSKTRGRAITNERKAVAYAHGNVHGGPAKVNPREKQNQYRGASDMWDTGTDTVFHGYNGGAGGEQPDLGAFLKQLERWYNYLQEIAKLEEKITYQEQLRSKINSDLTKNGSAYYKSLSQSMIDLNKKIEQEQTLWMQQDNYYQKRVSELQNTPFGLVYQVDNEGQIKYKDGMFDVMSDILGGLENDQPNYNPQEIFNWLQQHGQGEYMMYNESGEEIKQKDKEGKENEQYYKQAVEAWAKKMDKQRDDLQTLHDSVDEHMKAVLEAQEQQNELMAEMRDNQIELEEKVLNAIVEIRERNIEEMQKERDVYAEYADKLTNGLSDALNKEREMYQMQDDQAETDKMRRRLAILQTSGGSASEIIDLQEQIRQRDRDMYFEQQQLQIDTIKQASDLEIERLDSQIELEKELLEYQKAHGLLWEQVYEQMALSPEETAQFILNNTKDYWGQSSTQLQKEADELIFSANKWKEYRDEMKDAIESPLARIMKSIITNDGEKEWENYLSVLKDVWGQDFSNDEALKKVYLDKYLETSDPNQAAQAAIEALRARGAKTTAEQAAEAAAAQQAAAAGGSSGGTNGNSKSNYYSFTTTDASGRILTSQGGTVYANSLDEALKLAKEQAASMGRELDYVTQLKNNEVPKAAREAEEKKKAQEQKNKNNKNKNAGRAAGNAFAKGTLLGELGPEAYVSNGKLYIAGQYGAELVDLPEDAIVFNHQQTKRLLSTGLTSRGDAKNEDTAVGNDQRNSFISSFWRSVDNNRSSIGATGYSLYTGSDAIGSITNTDQGINIEHAEVNMNVEKIADDYDAKRAGEQALQEMLRIARKSGATSVRR